VVALGASYLAYAVVPLYYYYFDLKNHMQRALYTASVETDEEIRRSLMAVVKRHGITCGERDLQVVRQGDTIEVSLRYTEGVKVALFGKEATLFTLGFNASAKDTVKG
jgi:outer membrane lipopolysaccharide assembly protein LptE/RlpB